MPLKVNDKAPDFTLPSTSGKNFTLNIDGHGKPLILYFYPKDFTPGCTAEACEFRDTFSFFKELNIEVIGISRDDVETHLKFRQSHNLPFELLADLKGDVAEKYKATLPLINFTRRITYLLNKEHKIIEVYENLFASTKHIHHMIEKVKKGEL